uniref:Uncharacterized protein n=1 Tax=Anopheles atroparvus TaxID=41427 RepID=A0AAG5DPG8_ANOAO
MQNVQSNQSQYHLAVGQHPLNVSQAPVATSLTSLTLLQAYMRCGLNYKPSRPSSTILDDPLDDIDDSYAPSLTQKVYAIIAISISTLSWLANVKSATDRVVRR